MPIFEYICSECRHTFEFIMLGSGKPECPACSSAKLEKQLSVFAPTRSTGDGLEREFPVGACGTCGDPRGPGSCATTDD